MLVDAKSRIALPVGNFGIGHGVQSVSMEVMYDVYRDC